MNQTVSSGSRIPDRVLRFAMLIIPTVALFIGGWTLLRSLPLDYYPYFWDGAHLLSDISESDFGYGGPSELRSYALLKYGYALPVRIAVNQFGPSGVLAVNMTWFAIIIAAGVFSLAGDSKGSALARITAMLVFTSTMIVLPYSHKYLGMTNPTVQSMALWFLQFVWYGHQRSRSSRSVADTIVPGLLLALLVITDFPKWLVVGVPAIVVAECVCATWQSGQIRKTLAGIVSRVAVVLLWVVAVLGIVIVLEPDYYRNNILLRLTIEGLSLETIRPSLSWNFPLFLWYLGGLSILVFVLLFWNRLTTAKLRSRFDLVLAMVIVLIFSTLIWPRSARMFAVVVPLLILVFAQLVRHLCEIDPENSADASRRWQRIAQTAAVVVLLVVLVRSPNAGECLRLPTGVREVNRTIAESPRLTSDARLGTYLLWPFQLSVPEGHEWLYVPTYMYTDMRWVVSGDFIDEVLIEEQYLHGSQSMIWRTRQYRMLGTFRGEPYITSEPNDFYLSKYYLTESNFEDGQLAFMIRRASEVVAPRWRLHYVAGIVLDDGPPTDSTDTSNASGE